MPASPPLSLVRRPYSRRRATSLALLIAEAVDIGAGEHKAHGSLSPTVTAVLVAAVLLAGCDRIPVEPRAAPRSPGLLIVSSYAQINGVSAGTAHTCALDLGGAAECLGSNDYGQAPATKSAATGYFTQVSAGGAHTCARRTDGVVECWGYNTNGQAPAMKSAASGFFTQVSAGYTHTCARRSDGVIECWGNNGWGQAPATKSATTGSFTQVSAGDEHTCAVAGGAVECWGRNDAGEAPATKQPLTLAAPFTQVTAGSAHTCALRYDGIVECWGDDSFGQAPATKSAASGFFTHVSAGATHTCARRSDGVIECWGDDSFGQAPATKSSSNPYSPFFYRVSAGRHYTCAERNLDFAVECWGLNGWGNAPSIWNLHVLPTATFTFPASTQAGSAFALGLTNAQVPDHPEATVFKYAFDCGDGSGYGPFGSSNTVSCTAGSAGTRAVKGRLWDQDGDATEYTGSVTVYDNRPPVASVGGPYQGSEGSAVTLALSASDPDGDALTLLWNLGDGTNGTGTPPTSHTYADNASYTITLTASDPHGASDTKTTTAVIANVAPTLGAITAPLDPQPVGKEIDVSAIFTDPGSLDTHTVSIDWGDGTSAGAASDGEATGSHVYSISGVYTVRMTITDKDGGISSESAFRYVVVYDASAGFVTGGGWFDSPAGSYTPAPTATGKATFGFVAKYRKGAPVPDGSTEFQFETGNVNFRSTSYAWLVIAGARAQFKGEGTINGASGYSFLLTAIDGAITGGGGTDRVRIKIWNTGTGVVVYDNRLGAREDGNEATVVGGSIVIHQ